VKFVDCSLEAHGAAILDIYNEAIANTTAVYEYKLFPPEKILSWFAEKKAGRYPVIGAVDKSGALLGFSSYGVFRARPAHRGKGIGRALLEKIIEAGKKQNYHVMVGGIDAENEASIALHRQFGFVHAGTITQAGFKFGRWLDLAFYQLTLSTPAEPIDG
jgi:phosphinothricin acetyltransferase